MSINGACINLNGYTFRIPNKKKQEREKAYAEWLAKKEAEDAVRAAKAREEKKKKKEAEAEK